MITMASQIISLTVVYSTVYSDADQRKHQKLCVTGLCVGNSPGPVNSPHKGPVTRKMFPFDDVIMLNYKENKAKLECVHIILDASYLLLSDTSWWFMFFGIQLFFPTKHSHISSNIVVCPRDGKPSLHRSSFKIAILGTGIPDTYLICGFFSGLS